MKDIKEIIIKLLNSGKVQKHHTYDVSGIVTGNCRKISGSAGIDVNGFYIYPYESGNRAIEIVTESNQHYGYGFFNESGHIVDNSGRSVFEIV